MNHFFFKKLYTQSLTPFEILALSKQKRIFIEKREDSFLKYWKRIISKNSSDELFKKYCTLFKLSESDISLMISTVQGTPEEVDFPFWVDTLKEILKRINPESVNFNSKNQDKSFYQLLYPFIDFFATILQQKLKKSNIPIPNNNIIEQLKIVLSKDLLAISHIVLLRELSKFKEENNKAGLSVNTKDFFYRKFVLSIFSDKFQNLFLNYPMLARKLATKTHRYVEFVTRLFRRLQTDKSEIEYFLNAKFDKLKEIHLNSGDQHNGETTVILEFENSSKLVYKPGSAGITNAYNQFIYWVNANLGEELKTFNVVDKQTYSWLEYVEHLECKNINEIKLYYERAGILLGIAYFLNARDYHCENLIASSSCPVLIDHETIIGPDIKKLDVKNSDSDKIGIGTILESSLLPSNSQSIPSFMCGFGSSIWLKKNAVIPTIKNANEDNMARMAEMVTQNLYKLNKPILNSKIENLKDYESEFKKGFQRLYNLVIENQNLLLSKESPLESFKNLRIRFVYRATKVYHEILKHLNQPEYLSNSTKYGLKLELLARAYMDKEENW